MSICGFVDCESRFKELQAIKEYNNTIVKKSQELANELNEKNQKIKELNELDGGYREEIKELKLKNDLLKSNYDELMVEYKFYENLILDALKENNLLQDNGTKIAQTQEV